jgi:hypothetical protein
VVVGPGRRRRRNGPLPVYVHNSEKINAVTGFSEFPQVIVG